MSTESGLPEKKPAREGRSATFGTVSLFFAILTIVMPLLVFLFFGLRADETKRSDPNSDPNHGAGLAAFFLMIAGVLFAGIVAGLSSLVGTLTGIVALVRGERSMWRPIVGLIVNAPVAAISAFTIITAQISK